MSIEGAAATEIVRFSIKGVRYFVHLCGMGGRDLAHSISKSTENRDTHASPEDHSFAGFFSSICPDTPYDLYCIYPEQMHPLSQDLRSVSVPYFFMPGEENNRAFLLAEHSYHDRVNRILSTYHLPDTGNLHPALQQRESVQLQTKETSLGQEIDRCCQMLRDEAASFSHSKSREVRHEVPR